MSFCRRNVWSFVEGVFFPDKLRLVEHCFLFCCGKVSKVAFCFFSCFNFPRKARKLPGILQIQVFYSIRYVSEKQIQKGMIWNDLRWQYIMNHSNLAETNKISSLHWKFHNCKLNICAKLTWAAIGKPHFIPLYCVILWSLQWHLMIPCIACIHCIAGKLFTFCINQI